MIASGAHNKKILSLSFIKIAYVPVIFLCITNSILTYKIKFLEKNSVIHNSCHNSIVSEFLLC